MLRFLGCGACHANNLRTRPWEADPLTRGERDEVMFTMKNQEHVGSCMRTAAACCCLEIKHTSEIKEWMIGFNNLGVNNKTAEFPSLFQRFCLCQCYAVERKPSDLIRIRQLEGLTGVMMQTDSSLYESGAQLFTLKWSEMDVGSVLSLRSGMMWTDHHPNSRSVNKVVFGAFGKPTTAGLWATPPHCRWLCLMNIARCMGLTFRCRFSPGYESAFIDPMCNPCCCIPCASPCCELPKGIVAYDMFQDGSGHTLGINDGSHWEIRRSCCGRPFKRHSEIITVYHGDGSKGPGMAHLMEKATQQVMVTY